MSEAPPLVAGSRATLEVLRVAAGGDGVARHASGLTVFVDRGLPGDRVTGEVVRRKKRFAKLHVESIEAGAHREEPGCPVADTCGGCRFQHAAYADEWAWKSEATIGAVRRVARHVPLPEPSLVPASSTAGVRHRARVWLSEDEGRLATGFRRAGGHEVVPQARCPVLAEGLDAARAETVGLLAGVPGVRSLFLERDGVRGGVAVTVELEPDRYVEALRLLRPRVERTPISEGITTLAVAHAAPQRSPRGSAGGGGSGALGDEARRPTPIGLLGDARVVRERPCGEGRVVVHDVVTSFSQAFAEGNAGLQRAVVAALDDLERSGGVLELFCGSGNFSFPLIGAGWRLDAIEGVGAALAEAERAWNRWRASRGDALAGSGPGFHAADLRDGVPAPWDARVVEAAAIVLDPPRGGLSAALAAQLARHAHGRVVYVSCDPPALGRDLLRFASEGGWRVRSWALHDMFPRTAHVEIVAVLERDASAAALA